MAITKNGKVRHGEFNANPNPKESLRGLVNIHERAARNGVPVSMQLEREDPTSQYSPGDEAYQLDAFGRLMHAAGVVNRSNPAAGLYATPILDLLVGEHRLPSADGGEGEPIGRELGRALFMVWVERQVRRVKYGKTPSTRAVFVAEEESEAIGSSMRPWLDAGGLRDLDDLGPAIPITSLIAQDTQITGNAYRSVFVDDTDVGEFDFARVAETSELPEVTLGLHENTTRMHKSGRAVKWSYEAARQLRFDKMRLAITKMALDVEYGKVARALTVLVNGDTNPNTAPEVVPLTSLDAGAAGNLTLRALLQFRRRFRGAYRLNTLMARTPDIVDFEMLEVGLNLMPLVALPSTYGIGTISRIGDDRTRDSLQYADIEGTEIAAGTYLGFDNRFALERVSEIGAEITEADKFITAQVNVITFSDVDGFATLFPKAVKILNTAT